MMMGMPLPRHPADYHDTGEERAEVYSLNPVGSSPEAVVGQFVMEALRLVGGRSFAWRRKATIEEERDAKHDCLFWIIRSRLVVMSGTTREGDLVVLKPKT